MIRAVPEQKLFSQRQGQTGSGHPGAVRGPVPWQGLLLAGERARFPGSGRQDGGERAAGVSGGGQGSERGRGFSLHLSREDRGTGAGGAAAQLLEGSWSGSGQRQGNLNCCEVYRLFISEY